jgi:hypothetical protein
MHDDYLITKLVKSTLILVLKSQPQKKVVYRCKAENVLGTDQISFEIFKIQGNLKYFCMILRRRIRLQSHRRI